MSCYQQNAKIQYSYFDQGNEIKAIGYLTKNSRIISSSNVPLSDNCVKLKRFDLNNNREIIMSYISTTSQLATNLKKT